MSIDFPTPKWRTIIGVVADVQERGYDLAMKPGFYIPTSQEPYGTSDSDLLIVRTQGDPLSQVPAIRHIVASIDAEVPVSNVQTMDEPDVRSSKGWPSRLELNPALQSTWIWLFRPER